MPITATRISSSVASCSPQSAGKVIVTDGNSSRAFRKLVQAALLDDHILAHDEAVRSHLAQLGKNALHVLIGIHEDDHQRQPAAGIHQTGGLDPTAASEAGDGMKHGGAGDVF